MEMRDVVGYGGKYAVSDEGRVYNKLTGNWLKGGLTRDGYRIVTLYEPDYSKHRKRFVHRLVCEAFHGTPPDSSYEVDHINAIHDDNRPENLRWVTREENRRHAIEMKLQPPDRPLVAFNEDGDVIRFDSRKQAQAYGFNLSSLLEGQSYTCNGYAIVDAELFETVDIGVYFEQMEEVKARRESVRKRNLAASLMQKSNLKEIMDCILAESDISYSELGKLLGWSKQQVYQFLNKGQQSALVKTALMVDALGYKLAVVPANVVLCYDAYTVNAKVAV